MSRTLVLLALLSCACTLPALVSGAKHPVVFFPGYSLSVFEVTVENQTSQPSCPSSGSYLLHFEAETVQNGFDLTCMTNLLALNYNSSSGAFSEQAGVSVKLKDYGHPACAPFYEPLFTALKNDGLVYNSTLLAACYDWRMAPNVDVIPETNFVEDTRQLVLRAFNASGGEKVFLIGHSNGPIAAQHFLLTVGADFRDKYIAGFIPYAGNWPGAGLLVGLLFEGLGVTDFSFLPSAAATFETWPSTYFSAAQPAVFGDTLTLVETPERNYTSLDYSELYSDAGLTLAPVLTQKYLGLVTPKMFPEVAVYSFYGSGFSTVVGIVINNLTVGLPYSDLISAPGDINQEYITNEANFIWSEMKCYSFAKTERPGVNHFELPSDPIVVNATLAILNAPTPRGLCSSAATLVSPAAFLLNLLTTVWQGYALGDQLFLS